MSLSKEWTDWHLTPRGWEAGSQQTDFGKETKFAPPQRLSINLALSKGN